MCSISTIFQRNECFTVVLQAEVRSKPALLWLKMVTAAIACVYVCGSVCGPNLLQTHLQAHILKRGGSKEGQNLTAPNSTENRKNSCTRVNKRYTVNEECLMLYCGVHILLR